MMLSRFLGYRSGMGGTACMAVMLALAGAWLSSASQAEEAEVTMTAGPATPVEVLAQLNDAAIDEEGEPTGDPTYHSMMTLLHLSGLVDEHGLGADFACAMPEEAMTEEMAEAESMMPERSPMTIFVPNDATIAGLSDDVRMRLGDDPEAALAFVHAHTIAEDVSFNAVRSSLRWFRTVSGAQLQITGIQGHMVISPATPSHIRPKGSHVLCADEGPIFVLQFLNNTMDFALPEPQEAA